jgi:hypothetical protein
MRLQTSKPNFDTEVAAVGGERTAAVESDVRNAGDKIA